MNETSIASTDLVAWCKARMTEQRTTHITFENHTSNWRVGFWVYEVRQKNNLPPQAGYSEYTGIVVGGTDTYPGQVQVAQLQLKVVGDFIDCGLVSLKNQVSGKIITSYNFPDRSATSGRYFPTATFGIQDKPAFGRDALGWEFIRVLENGEIERTEGIFLETL